MFVSVIGLRNMTDNSLLAGGLTAVGIILMFVLFSLIRYWNLRGRTHTTLNESRSSEITGRYFDSTQELTFRDDI